LDPSVKEWCNLFLIKPSNLVKSMGLRRKVGYGLFSARPFRSGDRIAVFIGKIFDVDKLTDRKRTCYSLLFNIDKTCAPLKVRWASATKYFYSDAGYSPKDSPDYMKRPPVYFGLHYINNPRWEPDGKHQPSKTTRQTTCPAYNIQIGEDLVATTISDIEEGEELFWDYTAGSGVMGT
jgi:SET domain-containing protein